MAVEHCEECGFDSDDWTDDSALVAIGELPTRWRTMTGGLDLDQSQQRPLRDTWSIAEYADHVREVLFGMRFVLDSAVAQPGVDLGASPEPIFEPKPQVVDLHVALDGLEREARSLQQRLAELPPHAWNHQAVVDENDLDARWICRHAVHDATHHLMDVERLRAALGAR